MARPANRAGSFSHDLPVSALLNIWRHRPSNYGSSQDVGARLEGDEALEDGPGTLEQEGEGGPEAVERAVWA